MEPMERRLTRRDFLDLSLLGMGGLALFGIPDPGYAAEKKPKYGGRIKVAYPFGSRGLDAHKNQEFMDYQNYCLMYQGLTEQGPVPQMEIFPMLAQSWEISKDGREYTFALRRGVRFHHGKELDSGDVKYSIERVLNPAIRAPRAFALRSVESIDLIDKYHVRIRLNAPFATFLTSVSLTNCAIIPAGWEPSGTNPAPGTGPFVFKAFVPNETTEFTRFDQYWEVDEKTGDRLPYVDRIFVQKIVDDVVRFAALRAGDVDAVSGPPFNIVAKALNEKPIPGIVIGENYAGNMWICFNVTKAPYDHKKVRQAIAYAVDKKKLLDAVYWGLGEVQNNQPFLKASRFYIPVEDRTVDLAKAKQLLAEAGYPHGFKTEFLQYSVHYDVATAEVVMGQLREIGIEATMQVLDRAPYFKMMRNGEFGISVSGYEERYDWDDAYYMIYHSSEIDKNNWSRYSNPELDDLLRRGRTTLPWDTRKSIYKKAVEILKEEVPALNLYKPLRAYAFRDSVKGFREGFGMRFAWHGGGAKYWWLDK
jgi:peptide/nickel transport system substrate-binding protein